MTKAIYAGSFDPFTNGHLDILIKSANIFDQVYVVLGCNSKKSRRFPIEYMIAAIKKTLFDLNINNCTIDYHVGLIAEYAKEKDIKYMVRGLRNSMDYNYEENIAEVNKLIYPEMEYVYLRSNNIAISSSMVMELYMNGADISAFVPKAIKRAMNGENVSLYE